jgi:outer membrane protein TolC
MKASKSVALSLVLALWSASAPSGAADPPGGDAAVRPLRRMRLDECVTTALTQNVEIAMAADEVTATESARGAAAGHFGPKLRVEASATRYDSAYELMGFPVHDAFMWNASASVTQPLTTLFAIYEEYKVRDLGVDVAAIRREAVRRDTASHVVDAYYRLLQSERLDEVAVASVGQLEAQLRQAESFHAHGVVSQDDVLRAKLAVAGAQQRRIQARAHVDVERSRLAVLMGLPPDTPVDAEPLAAETVPATDVSSLDRAEQAAIASRVELRELDRRVAQHDREVRLAWLKLAPQVNAVAAYVHNEGSSFSPPNSTYAGLVASWDAWDWGATTSGISEANARRHQAELARRQLDDRIRLEVRQSFVGVQTAREAMNVASAAVASAEENFRLVKKRYEASSATTFDVVDAEALLTQARGQLETARYDLLIARTDLRRAMGEAPETLARP